MSRRALALLLLALVAARASDVPWGEQALGVVVVGEGDGGDWQKLVKDVRKQLRSSPVEFLTGEIAPRELQRALDRLQAARARRIAIVPVQLSSESPNLVQIRYLAGIAEYPSAAYLAESRDEGRVIPRVKAKVPLVMTSALDGDDAVAEILLARAKELGRRPQEESVVLLGDDSADLVVQLEAEKILAALAARVKELGGYRSVTPAFMRTASPRPARGGFARLGAGGGGRLRSSGEDPERGTVEKARAAVSSAGRTGRALVVPYLLSADGTERAMRRNLDGLFFAWRGRALLPDERIARWIARKAAETSAAPDMVRYKDSGKALPAAVRKRFVP